MITDRNEYEEFKAGRFNRFYTYYEIDGGFHSNIFSEMRYFAGHNVGLIFNDKYRNSVNINIRDKEVYADFVYGGIGAGQLKYLPKAFEQYVIRAREMSAADVDVIDTWHLAKNVEIHIDGENAKLPSAQLMDRIIRMRISKPGRQVIFSQ